jgi:chaperonin cofactor prefoldin
MDTTIANDTNKALDQVSAKLEDIFTRIEALEEQSNITKVKGFKNEK